MEGYWRGIVAVPVGGPSGWSVMQPVPRNGAAIHER